VQFGFDPAAVKNKIRESAQWVVLFAQFDVHVVSKGYIQNESNLQLTEDLQ
jgi:hypothetical protein